MHRIVLYAVFFCVNLIILFNHVQSCPKSSPLVGLRSELLMVRNQLRGEVTILDDCSFRVSRFDMLPGEVVRWWGAVGPEFGNLTTGFMVSELALNGTFRNASFTVQLKKNVTWDQIRVLSVWDLPTASNFGHIVLFNDTEGDPITLSNHTSANYSTTVPTMLDNCKVLAKDFVVRWSLNVEKEGYIDVALEAAISAQSYMSFGWGKPTETMLYADVVVAGFTEEGVPFSDDFYITAYLECSTYAGSLKGVCPDTVFDGANSDWLVNNTRLVYGHRSDGVSFIRYRRPLISPDKKYDNDINLNENMTVVWALGMLRPPDTLRPYYLPHIHLGQPDVTFGDLLLNVSEATNDCSGPLDAANKEDQDVIIADSNLPLIVTSGSSLHYPNPPNPAKVLFINKKEAPLLRVERGVPVTFSIQAGHDVALYITSDVLGGNATLRNKTETIYAGGSGAEGVQASPKKLIWVPNRNTPDQIYYQSLYQQKMGWKIQVVDGGLPDMYHSNVLLDDQQVTLFWTISNESISLAVRGEKRSGYVAIGLGSGMVNSYAYVGWIDDNGKGHVNSYWIDGKDASSVHPTKENLTYVRCKSENGIITFEFTRPLVPHCLHNDKVECKNIIDPTTPLKVVWAMGSKWSDGDLRESNMHSATSHRPVRLLLLHGSAEAEQDLRPVLAVHGFMMFLAWGILLPGGILSARYLKHVKGDGWFRIHVYLQYSGLVIALIGLLFAIAELRVFIFSSLHAKLGLVAIILSCAQPANAWWRPKVPANAEAPIRRIIWEYIHVIIGRSAIVVGCVAMFTGMKHLEKRYGGETIHSYNWALTVWIVAGTLVVIYLEFRERRRQKDRNFGNNNNIVNSRFLGNLEDDDAVDLLSESGAPILKTSDQGGKMEVQLEPLNN